MPDYHKSSLSEARSYAAAGDHLLAYDVATGAADDDTACTDHDATSLGLIIGRDGYWFLPRIVPLCLAPQPSTMPSWPDSSGAIRLVRRGK
jgi:hypothetical protein